MKPANTIGTAHDGDSASHSCFTRTWWKPNPKWPNGREPSPGPKHYKAHEMTITEAREFCEEWNSTHDEGPMSLKCEFERD